MGTRLHGIRVHEPDRLGRRVDRSILSDLSMTRPAGLTRWRRRGASAPVAVTTSTRPVAQEAFEGRPAGDPGRGHEPHDVHDGGLRHQQRIEQQARHDRRRRAEQHRPYRGPARPLAHHLLQQLPRAGNGGFKSHHPARPSRTATMTGWGQMPRQPKMR